MTESWGENPEVMFLFEVQALSQSGEKSHATLGVAASDLDEALGAARRHLAEQALGGGLEELARIESNKVYTIDVHGDFVVGMWGSALPGTGTALRGVVAWDSAQLSTGLQLWSAESTDAVVEETHRGQA